MDKREVAFTQARTAVLHEMLRAGAFDMDNSTRADFVSSLVEQLKPDYPDMTDQLWKELTGKALRATYGDAALAAAAATGRGEGLERRGEEGSPPA